LGTGARLTDKEIDDEWIRWQDDELDKFEVDDIPIPPGGFADPDTWEEPEREEEPDLVDREGLTEAQILSGVTSRGIKATAYEYGVPDEWLSNDTSDKELARMILDMHGKPWPRESAPAPPAERSVGATAN